jgi:malonyl CoA-acyl carrier protein transacylase
MTGIDIAVLLDKGRMEFEEVGPGHVLTGLIHRIKKETEASPAFCSLFFQNIDL